MSVGEHQPLQRTYGWIPHVPGRRPLENRSGTEYFQALKDGVEPEQPITSTIGWTIEHVEPGILRLKADVSPWLFHSGGLVHGGALTTLLDSAASGAVLSACKAGQGAATSQLSINFIRGVRLEDGPLTAEGKVVSMGNRVATGCASLIGPTGTLHAQATATCLIFNY